VGVTVSALAAQQTKQRLRRAGCALVTLLYQGRVCASSKTSSQVITRSLAGNRRRQAVQQRHLRD
jgi:hypothetical protein